MHGVISGGSKQSVEAGATIIRAGGNALDAVLAAAFATTSGEASITSMAGGWRADSLLWQKWKNRSL